MGNLGMTATTDGSDIARNVALKGINSVDLRGELVITTELTGLRGSESVNSILAPNAPTAFGESCLVVIATKPPSFMGSSASLYGAKTTGAIVKMSDMAIPTSPTFAAGCLGIVRQLLTAVDAFLGFCSANPPAGQAPASLTSQNSLGRRDWRTAISTSIGHLALLPPLNGGASIADELRAV